MSTSELPVQFGRYQLLERIAQGGMADVFLARTFGEGGFEKRLVVKRILPGLARSPRFVSMFINEARIAVSLNHPNIVQVYDLGRVDGDWFIAMEYIHGRDLTRIVRTLRAQGALLPIHLAVYVVLSCLRGLGYAHQLADGEGNPLGIVHGDVSPHNLVVSFAGEVKLVDFGIARVAGTGWGDNAARPGGGKFAYMSPEQVAGLPLDRRSDIFSAGIVLYELLVGHRLYQHEDPDEKLRLVREAVVPDPRLENPDIPDDLWRVLQKALTRSCDDRYPSTEAFEEALRGFLYAHRLPGDMASMAAFLHELFGGEATIDPAVGDLRRLAEDLRKLDKGIGGRVRTASGIPRATPSPQEGSATLRAAEELRPVAVLCVEYCGHTDISQTSADPTELVERQRDILAWFERQAHRFGGTLNPGSDDTVTLLFGVHKVRPDDLRRALECALETRTTVDKPEWRDHPISLSMGLHYGEVAIAYGREDEPFRVLGRGDTFKLARRLAGSAELGEIRVSNRVAALTRDAFGFEQAPPLPMKGHTEEAQPWILVNRLSSISSEDAGNWLVRGDEVETLREALVALGDGRGCFVVITGEMGVGKSRLLRDLVRLARLRRLPAYGTRAYPFDTDRPLAAFRDLVAGLVGVEAQDSARRVREKLRRLAQIKLSEPDIAVLSTLFTADQRRFDAHGSDMVQETTRRLLRGLVADGPVLLIIEDIEFLDPMEQRLLLQAAALTRERPLLLLASTGLAPSPQVLAQSPTLVSLKPLPEEAQARFIAETLQVDEVDPALVAVIAADAAGNPQYALELIKVLEHGGHIQRDGGRARLGAAVDPEQVPATLRGLVAARIDALDPATRGILQVAATIGMRFPLPLLEEAAGVDDLERFLEDLLSSGLLLRKERGSEVTLEFASQSIWDAASRSSLGVQRREHHRMVASGILRLHADNLDPHLESLARHEAASGSYLEAARHISTAGNLHIASAFLDRALSCFEAGLEWLHLHREQGGHEEDVRAEGEVRLHRSAGEAAFLMGQARTAERHLQLALDRAEELGLPEDEALASLTFGRLCLSENRRKEAQAFLEQAQDLATSLEDTRLGLECLESLARLALDEGDPETAQARWQDVLARSEPGSQLAGKAMLGLASCLVQTDRFDEAVPWMEKVLALARTTGDRPLLGHVHTKMGTLQRAAGRLPEAVQHYEQALQVRKDIGYRMGVAINLHKLGATWFLSEELTRATAAFHQSMEQAREMSWTQGLAMSQVYLGYLDALRGDEDRGLESLCQAIGLARSLGDRETVATGLWLQSRMERRRGERELADDLLQAALRTARACGAHPLARTFTLELPPKQVRDEAVQEGDQQEVVRVLGNQDGPGLQEPVPGAVPEPGRDPDHRVPEQEGVGLGEPGHGLEAEPLGPREPHDGGGEAPLPHGGEGLPEPSTGEHVEVA